MSLGKILVTGATGNTGSGIAAALLAQGHDVRVLVRNERKAESLKEQGAEVVVADLDEPASIDPNVFEGVERMYACTWNGPTALAQSRTLLDAVLESGVNPVVVRASAFGSPASRIIQQVKEADHLLKSSGLRWTLLRPTFFMQNLMMLAPTIREQGKVYWDWGDGKAGIVDVRDIVDVAVATLTAEDGRYEGRALTLTGPEPVGFADVARTMGEVLGRDIDYVAVPHQAAKQAMVGMGMPEWIADGYVELNEGFTNGFADTVSDAVEEVAGHAPRSLREFLTDYRTVWEG